MTARFLAHDKKATDLDVRPWFEPARNYTSIQVLAEERCAFFRNYPVLVGFSSDLPSSNSYLTTEVDGLPIVVTRAETGYVSAFVNVCRHRAAVLFNEPSGCLPGRTIACPYHSWTYDLDGRLTAQPQSAGGFDSASTGQSSI